MLPFPAACAIIAIASSEISSASLVCNTPILNAVAAANNIAMPPKINMFFHVICLHQNY